MARRKLGSFAPRVWEDDNFDSAMNGSMRGLKPLPRRSRSLQSDGQGGVMSSAAPLIVVAPVRDLAAEINQAHEAVRRFIWSALDHAHHCGDLLIEAKAQAGHGHWKDWLAENCPGFSGRTASAYIRVSKHWDEIEAKRQDAADLSLSAALKFLGVPRLALNSGCYRWNSGGDPWPCAQGVRRKHCTGSRIVASGEQGRAGGTVLHRGGGRTCAGVARNRLHESAVCECDRH